MKSLKKPLVSVLMTVYNREQFISQAIESILESTYQNFELIIVDDQSTDRSVEIARSYQVKDDRIKIYINEENLGDYPNRNMAASYAIGKYLKYVDADDMIYPFGLEQLVYYMEQFPNAGYGLCSLSQDPSQIYPIQLEPSQAYEMHYYKSSIFQKAPLSSIINRDAFNKVNGFTGKRHLGDFEMWHIMSRKFPVVLMPEGIVWYRVHEFQEMHFMRVDPAINFKYIILSKEMINNNHCPLSLDQKKEILKKIDRIESKAILSAVKRHSIKKGVELFKVSDLNFIQLITKGILNA